MRTWLSTVAWLVCLLHLAVPASAQQLTKDDVHRALVEHHTVLNSYCLANVFEDSMLRNDNDATLNARLLASGHAERFPGTDLIVTLTTEGRKYVQRNVRTSMMDGRFLHCFAIGKVSVSEVNVFKLVAGTTDAEVSYTVLVRDLPEWLRTIDIGTYQPGPVSLDWFIHVAKKGPQQIARISGEQAILVHANGRWMTNLMYERLSRGIR